jgi:hypothetical protein
VIGEGFISIGNQLKNPTIPSEKKKGGTYDRFGTYCDGHRG